MKTFLLSLTNGGKEINIVIDLFSLKIL